MPFIIVRNDILNMEVDAIVNSTSSTGIIAGGTERKLIDKAGDILYKSRIDLGDIGVAENKISPAYGLLSKFVIHTVCPFYDEAPEDEGLLKLTFINILETAKASKCSSLALPLIGTGFYSYPKRLALQIAEDAIKEFLEENEMYVYLVVYDDESYLSSKELFNNVTDYLDRNLLLDAEMFVRSKIMKASSDMEHLDNRLDEIDEGFSKTLLRLIEESGEKNSTIYHRANVDKRLFSKIKNNVHYHPSKNIAIAFAIALKLNLDETEDLISRAGYALSRSIVFDLIIEYCISKKIYNIFTINEILYDKDQDLLGSSIE